MVRRDYDLGDPVVVPWTAELALMGARVDTELPKPVQEAQIEAKIAMGSLPPEAIQLLRDAGYAVGL